MKHSNIRTLQVIMIRLILFSFVLTHINQINCTTRLTKTVIPLHYDIFIRPKGDFKSFFGRTCIEISVGEEQNEIVLHSKNLTIQNVCFNGRTIENFRLVPEEQKLIIPTRAERNTSHRIEIEYYGNLLQHNGEGLIRESFGDDNRNGYLIVSEFEANSARKAFPCFDDPHFKATFAVSVVTPKDSYVALSNMDVVCKCKGNKSTYYKFNTTLPMSTYLLAIAVTNYDFKEHIHNTFYGKSIALRFHSFNITNEKFNNFSFLEIGKAIDYFVNYTNLNYTLSKIDFIEYNRTAPSIATENWGLVTLRQGFWNNEDEYSISYILTHEISHSWFGNLVTNDWRIDVWLHEGLATHFTLKILSERSAERPSESIFWEKVRIMADDCNGILQPVVPDDNDDDEDKLIDKVFQDATYYKAAAILIMIETLIGETKYRQSIQSYLSKHEYGTVNSNDFINEIKEFDPNMLSFIKSFLYYTSIPILEVSRGVNSSFMIKQKRCGLGNFSYNWTIPLFYQTDLDVVSKVVWLDKSMENRHLIVPNMKWIVFNPHSIGYYLIQYSDDLLEEMAEYSLNLGNMKYLMSEASLLFELQHVTCDVPLKLITKIDSEAWPYSSQFLRYLKDRLSDEEYRQLMEFVNKHRKRTGNHKYSIRSRRRTTKIIDSRIPGCMDWISNELKTQ